MIEIWKDLAGHEIFYMVSNTGRVFSKRYNRLMSPTPDSRGYPQLIISNEVGKRTMKVHWLVWDTFGDGKRNGRIITVDHIDGNKCNNCIDNLQLLSSRDNKIKSSTKEGRLPGTARMKCNGKWKSEIIVNHKRYHLGTFKTEADAHNAYANARKFHNV